ncbi:hyaluronidase-1-like isoform X2 [Dysidea avara]|uniref:hyaluronidase-1-like isoform X2 n=1 Tax=Dysidea avara TaxID=196820 RepID=UPI00331B3464
MTQTSMCLLLLYIVNAATLPDWPYAAVWNCATILCVHKGVPLFNVTKFDILQNINDSRMGQYITLFPGIGKMPVINNGEYINGGIPQLGDLAAHVSNASQDIQRLIPDEDYDGLAVLDFETWRPLFEHNFDSMSIYQKASVDLVKQQYPNWTDNDLILATAKAQWDAAAQLFMESTLMVGHQLRPRALWGYYEFPRCYGNIVDLQCDSGSQESNDKLMWLYEASTALFPSLYLSALHNSTGSHMQVAYMKEAQRVVSQRSAPIPIYPYTQYLYERSQLFLDDVANGLSSSRYSRRDRQVMGYLFQDDLLLSYLIPALSGASGVVIWGGTDTVANPFICEQAKLYVDQTLGPTLQWITEWTQQCSRDHCSGNGHCVTISDSFKINPFTEPTDDLISCDCYINYSGKNCSIKYVNII